MPGRIEALGIFLLLLPGFTFAYVVQLLAVRREQTELDKVVESLLFTFLLLLITLPFFQYSLPITWKITGAGTFQVHLAYGYLITLFVASVGLGILYGASIHHDWILTPLRRLRVTERTARSAIWHDVFEEGGGWVQVQLKDGKKALGWVRYYSDDKDESSLFLESASWIDDEGGEQQIIGPGLFLTKNAEIESVMFLDSPARGDEEHGT